jgi:hypothetical protein
VEELLHLWWLAFGGRHFTTRALLTFKAESLEEQAFVARLARFIAMQAAPPELIHYEGSVSVVPEEDPTSVSPATLERRFNLYVGRVFNGLTLTSMSTGGPSVFQVVRIIQDEVKQPKPKPYRGKRPTRFERKPVV